MSSHVQELRGHYVRRLPGLADLSTRSPIVLTERDRRLLVAVHQLGFLTTDLLELAFFPQEEPRSAPSSKAYQRVRDLWLWGYLERIELPVARLLGGRRPFLYALGRRGVPCVQAERSDVVQPRRLDRLDHVFIDHDLQAAALWANLTAQLRDGTGCLRWVGERDLRARRMRVRAPRADYWMPFLPDAYFEVLYPNGDVQCALVEIDMGTLTLRRFARKVVAFETALSDGVFRRHIGREQFEVFVLTQSSRRLESLRKTAEHIVEPDRRGDYYLATFEALEPAVFATAAWRGLDDEAYTGVLWH